MTKQERETRTKILTREFLVEQYINQGIEAPQIARNVGVSKFCVTNRLKTYRIVRDKNYLKPGQDLKDKRFGKWTVLYSPGIHKGHSRVWICQCDCGAVAEVLAGNLKQGISKSCGCCRSRNGKDNPRWKGCGQLSGSYFCQVKHQAMRRGIPFDLTIEEMWGQFEKQNGRCALTGWEISLEVIEQSQTASLDRIDSSKGYSTDNIEWIHKDLQGMKWDYEKDYFVSVCFAIAEHYKDRRPAHEKWIRTKPHLNERAVRFKLFKKPSQSRKTTSRRFFEEASKVDDAQPIAS